MRILRPQLGPGALSERDSTLLQNISEVEEYIVSNYRQIARALVAKAKRGDRTAAELLLRFGIAPVRERLEERQAVNPAPMPVIVRATLFQFRQRAGRTEPLELTPQEFASLPERQQKLIEGNVHIIDAPALAAAAPAAPEVPPHPAPGALAAEPPPNAKCEQCGDPFFTNRHALRCSRCRRERSKAKLQAHLDRKRKERAARQARQANLREGAE